MSKRTWSGRRYLGRDEDGKQLFEWLGRFDSKRERDEAVTLARLEAKKGGSPVLPDCDAYVDRYLADYARRHKDSSLKNRTQGLKRFRKDFAGRSLDVPRQEMKDYIYGEGRWKNQLPRNDIAAISALYTYAINEDDLEIKRNPARGLTHATKGRSKEPPPTPEQFQQLVDACSALGEYAPMMRSLFKFASFQLMRPGECYALEWSHVDFDRMRVKKALRVYEGRTDTPKSGEKLIALTVPGRDAIMGNSRDPRYVFTTQTGKRMSQGALSRYWGKVQAAAGLDFDFYHASKHYGVWYLWTQRNLSERAIAAQAGWSFKTVLQMLEIYGHGDVGALEEIDAAFSDAVTPGLRVIEGGGTQT